MTISTQGSQIEYTANGTQTVFDFDFKVMQLADLKVYSNGVLMVGGYSVDFVGEGGTVTFTEAPANGVVIKIKRATVRVQELILREFQKLPAAAMEANFDKIVAMVQELASTDVELQDELTSLLEFLNSLAGLPASQYIGETPPPYQYVGMRWYDPSVPTTYVYDTTNGVGSWIEEPVQSLENSAFISQSDVLSDGRPALRKLTVGDEVLTAPAVRDDVVVGKTITALTDSHAFADRTVISNFTDAGTYGTFDATTQYAHTSGTANHLYTFQGRGKKTGAGNLDNYASFYSQPNLSGGTVTDMHHVRVYDNAGTSTVTNQHGVHIRPLSQGVNNYALFSWGDTPSIHVGKFTVGVSTVDNTAAVAVVNKVNMTGISQYGVKSDCGANSAALTAYAAYMARVNTSGTGYTLPYGAGLMVEDANLSAGANVDALYGFWIKNQTKGTVNAAMRLDVAKATNKWNLYATGDADNYLKGNLGIGVFQPTARIELAASPAGTPVAPIKLTAGVNLATPQNGCLEFDGTNLYFTVGGVRKIVQLV